MGLIKTAIVTGGGVYAVNKLAKTVETRRSSSLDYEQPEYSQREYPQRSRTPPQHHTSAQTRTIEGTGREATAPPGYWYSAEYDAYYPIWRAQQGDTSNNATFSTQRGHQVQGQVDEQSVHPPSYSTQHPTGHAWTPSQRNEHAQGALSIFSRGDLAGQAIDFIMHAADGNKRKS